MRFKKDQPLKDIMETDRFAEGNELYAALDVLLKPFEAGDYLSPKERYRKVRIGGTNPGEQIPADMPVKVHYDILVRLHVYLHFELDKRNEKLAKVRSLFNEQVKVSPEREFQGNLIFPDRVIHKISPEQGKYDFLVYMNKQKCRQVERVIEKLEIVLDTPATVCTVNLILLWRARDLLAQYLGEYW